MNAETRLRPPCSSPPGVVLSRLGTTFVIGCAFRGVLEGSRRNRGPQGISTVTRAVIHRRDSWTCRYCRARTIAPPILRFLSELYPDEFPYHPNWKAGQVHPAYLLLSTSLDHVDPGGRGGSWREPGNLVTACWPCNTGKADLRLDEVGWALLDVDDVRSDWDGLSSATEALWARAGRPDIYRDWRRALAARE
jgi:5-methylcytosine-specific restriction endonuclease McrA